MDWRFENYKRVEELIYLLLPKCENGCIYRTDLSKKNSFLRQKLSEIQLEKTVA